MDSYMPKYPRKAKISATPELKRKSGANSYRGSEGKVSFKRTLKK